MASASRSSEPSMGHSRSDGDNERGKEPGHEIVEQPRGFGNMQAVVWDRREHRVTAAADPRGVGRAVVVAD